MSEAQQLVETDSASHLRNRNRVARDEAELQELIRKARGEPDEAEESVEASESEPSSESVEDTSVQNESVPEQEAKDDAPEAEAPKEDDDAGLSAEEKSFKKRYSDIRKYMQEKDAEHKTALEKLQKQLELATKNELVLPKSEDEVEAWAKKYPDVAGIVEAIAEKKASERASELDGRLKEIEEMRTQARKEKAEAELAAIHPDYNDLRSDDAFHEWASEQPKVVQDALYENMDDVKSVARVIDLYKSDKGITAKKTSSADKGAASSVKTKRTAAPEADDASTYLRESQVAKMPIKEYEQRQQEILDAQRKGKFIYDMTKR